MCQFECELMHFLCPRNRRLLLFVIVAIWQVKVQAIFNRTISFVRERKQDLLTHTSIVCILLTPRCCNPNILLQLFSHDKVHNAQTSSHHSYREIYVYVEVSSSIKKYSSSSSLHYHLLSFLIM